MEIVLDKKSENLASIKLVLNEADYQSQVDKKITEYSKKATIKGFRPGKVPTGLIKKMYGKGILVDEINHIISHSLTDYFKENDLTILGEPIPDEEAEKLDWDNQKDFEFVYTIGLVPPFEYDLTKLTIDSYTIIPDEKALNQSVIDLQKRYGAFENPEVSEAGDIFVGKIIKIKKEGQEIKTEAVEQSEELIQVQEAGQEEKFAFLGWEDIKEEMQGKFLGISKDAKIIIDIKNILKEEKMGKGNIFAFSMTQEEFAEAEGEYEFVLERINRMTPAVLDQAFFDQVFGPETISTEEEFKEKVKEQVIENYKSEADALSIRQIEDYLSENIQFDLPDDFLKKWLLLTNNDGVTEDMISDEYVDFSKRLKWNLILNRIAKDKEIKVEESEVIEKAGQMFMANFQRLPQYQELLPQIDVFIRNYLTSENGRNFEKIYGDIREEKVLNLVKTEANIKTSEISMEDFEILAKKFDS